MLVFALGATAGLRVSGVRNATFDNIAELVIAGFALKAGLLEIVRASIAGSVLGNTLLILSLCMLVGGWRHGVQTFSRVAASMNGVLLLVTATGMIAPALLSPPLGHRMTLVFAPVEIVAIPTGALITAFVTVDGESTWIEGLAFVAVHIIFAAVIYVWPIGALGT